MISQAIIQRLRHVHTFSATTTTSVRVKSEGTMNRLGLSDIISKRGSILGGAAKLLYATDDFHDSNVKW
jgi:hypothetical protein